MNELEFVKMHGLGNDFVLIDARKQNLNDFDLKELAIDICDRHFGVGADGLLVVWTSDKAHYRMQILNSDGSEPEMCGNGIRCFAKYVFEEDKLKEEVISVETRAGIIIPAVILADSKVIGAEVDMGMPKDEGELQLQDFNFKKVSMGNPHAVAFVDHFNDLIIAEIGPVIELDSHFPNKTNVEFVKILNDKEIEIKVWERGAGETLACGTGACAAVYAANISGKVGRKVLVHLPGGKMEIEITDEGHILMRGPAETVFSGKYFV